MYLEEVIIDGFKSYAHRTELKDIDPHFTAITGQNGHGKSNIFDAICFVLGLNNTRQMRAEEFAGLIYKNGQAGITKASVTLVFNNSNKAEGQCPVGYEGVDQITVTRQIMVGGRKKYILNGRVAQPQSIMNLFHSVQLNVNNPHFMIMQGKITSVVNMKPAELLGLLEEAAGTRMWETRKREAQNRIERQQLKLKEIERMIGEEIEPKMRRLQADKQAFDQYQQNQVELQKLTRFVLAWKYHSETGATATLRGRIADRKAEQQQAKDELADLQRDITRGEKEVERAKAKLAKETQANTAGLEAREREAASQLTQAAAVAKAKATQLDLEKRRLAEAQQAVRDIEAGIAAKVEEKAVAARDAQGVRQRAEKLQEKLVQRQQQLDMLRSGIAATEEGESVTDALRKFEKQRTTATTEVENLTQRERHVEAALKKRTAEAGRMDDELPELTREMNRVSDDIRRLEAELERVPFNAARAGALDTEITKAAAELHQLTKELGAMSTELSGIDFHYQARPGFDRSAVKGVVANLLKVKDPKHLTAVEVVAGGRLYNVVVTTDAVGQELLQSRLKRRVTFIPLNKISASVLPDDVQRRADKLCPGKARLALSIVGYDEEVASAMKYIFGNTFVCDENTGAKQLMQKLHALSVTLDGDSYNPSGIVTGGARGNLGQTLKLVHTMQALRDRVDEQTAALEALRAEQRELGAHRGAHARAKTALETKRQELGLLQRRAERTTRSQMLKECEEMKQQLTELRQRREENRELLRAADERLAQLQDQAQSFTDGKQRIAAAQKDIKELQKAIKEAAPAVEAAKKAIDHVATEHVKLQEELADSTERVKEQQQAVDQAAAEHDAAAQRANQAKAEHDAAKGALDAAIARLSSASDVVRRLEDKVEETRSQAAAVELKLKKLEHAIRGHEKELDEAGRHAARLLEQNPWMAQVRELFGQPDTEFDFTRRNPAKAQEQLERTKAAQESSAKTINNKVVSMFETVKQQYDDLEAKRQQVMRDRDTIYNVIADLEEQKKTQLLQSYKQVNEDFSSIFADLLPNAMARLDAVNNRAGDLAGLELKVGFSKQWKESLSELSGGQRSLMALAFLLSLLRFNPAPMYILDEIDAALDISHTQNIGNLLQRKFTSSQFIVISLKEGMFSNANVLFRAQAENGQSSVKRFAGERARR